MRDLIIPFKGLKEAIHEFESELDNKFFDEFKSDEISGGDLRLKIKLDKKSQMMIFFFEIKGEVNVMCDRCLDFYNQDVEFNGKLYVKYGDETREETDELLVLSRDEYEIDLSKFIYDSIVLSLPMMRFHPDDEEGYSTCNEDMLDKLGFQQEKKEVKSIDPRWEALKNLKN